jgi:hypothetical protein
MTATEDTATPNLGGKFYVLFWIIFLLAGIGFYVLILPPLVAKRYGNAECWTYYVFLHRFALIATLLYTTTYYYRGLRVFRSRDKLQLYFAFSFIIFLIAFGFTAFIYLADFVESPTSYGFVKKSVDIVDFWGPVILVTALTGCDLLIWLIADGDAEAKVAEKELYRQTVILVDLPIVISTWAIKALFFYENLHVSACLPSDLTQMTPSNLVPHFAYAFFGGVHAFQFFAFNIIFLLLLFQHRWPERSPRWRRTKPSPAA